MYDNYWPTEALTRPILHIYYLLEYDVQQLLAYRGIKQTKPTHILPAGI
jgi:hypothetical protein